MNEIKHTELGLRGEEIAANHLITSGYEILDRNFRFGHLEIDLIAEKKNTVVFVEVKTRSTDIYGEPYMAVSRTKQRQIIRAANSFLNSKSIDKEARFDVFSIILNRSEMRIEHIESAFYP